MALTAVPGFAASPTNKLYTIDVTGPLGTNGNTSSAGTGDQTFKVKITNSTPGNSNFQSAIINAPSLCASERHIYVKSGRVLGAPDSNNGNNNGANLSATVSWLDKDGNPQCTKPASMTTCPTVGVAMQQGKLYVQNIDPVKSANNLHQFISVSVTLTIPAASGCAAASTTPQWSAVPINGNSLSGDTFVIGTPNTGQTTSVSAQCGSVTITKYNDTNVNDTKDNGESVLTDGWAFSVYNSSNQLVTTQTTGASGSVTFSLPGGQTYKVCETDPKLDPNSAGWAANPWSSTDQDGCKSVTPSAASGSTLRFGNAIGNLICGGSLTTDDGNVTVTRLDNTDGEVPCILKPASLTNEFGSNGDSVLFLPPVLKRRRMSSRSRGDLPTSPPIPRWIRSRTRRRPSTSRSLTADS